MRRSAGQLAGHVPFAPFPATASAPPTSTGFAVTLALFTILSTARASDIVPALAGLPLGKLLGAVMIVMAATVLPREYVSAALRNTTVRAMLVISVLVFLSVPFSVWRSASVGFIQSKWLPAVTFLFIACAAFADRRTVRLSIKFLVGAVTVGAVRMIVDPVLDSSGRALFGSLDANDTAALMVSTIPFALMLAAEKGPSRRVLYAVPLLCVLAVVKTGSRGGLLGLVAIGLWLIYLAPPRRRLSYVMGIVAGAAVFSASGNAKVRERFASIFNYENDYNMTTREGRIEVWKRGIRYMVTHPILGVGVAGFETAEGTISGKRNEGFGIRHTAAHNSYVQIGAELGVGGLVAFITAFVSAGVGCWRVRRRAIAARTSTPGPADEEAALAGSALAALIGVSVTGFFLSFAFHPITYFCLAVCAGVVLGSPYSGAGLVAGGAGPYPSSPELSPRPATAGAQGWRSAASRRHTRV